jgi:hypothetical protein
MKTLIGSYRTSLKETDNQEDQELFLIAEIERNAPEE